LRPSRLIATPRASTRLGDFVELRADARTYIKDPLDRLIESPRESVRDNDGADWIPAIACGARNSATKRMHVHVGVENLQHSVRFYSAPFAAQPSVVKTDYAKWMLDDPRVPFRRVVERRASTTLGSKSRTQVNCTRSTLVFTKPQTT
jgi:hypothetical protein